MLQLFFWQSSTLPFIVFAIHPIAAAVVAAAAVVVAAVVRFG